MSTESTSNLTRPAMILSGALLLTGIVLIFGFWFVMDRQASRLERAIQQMREGTSRSVDQMGDQVTRSLDRAIRGTTIQLHAPDGVKIRGPAADGSLPTDVRLRDAGKEK